MMKKFVLCLSMLVATCFSSNVVLANEVAPCAYGSPCGSCGGLSIRETYPNSFVSYVNVSCTHGKSGQDYCKMYATKYIDRCTLCSGVDTIFGTDYSFVLVSCNGY